MRFRGVQRVGGQVVIDTPFLRDALLTCKAKGLLAVLYSWPQGEPVTITALLGYTCDGRDAVTKAWNELESAGYLVTSKDGVQIAENRKPSTVAVPEKHEINPVAFARAFPSLVVDGGKVVGLTNGARIAENPESARAAVREKPKKALVDALRKIAKGHGGELPKNTNGTSKGRSSPLLVENNTKGLSSDDEPGDLFGAISDPARESIMRNSAIGTWEVFKSHPSMREAEALGIDVLHYFKALMRWSDKKNRTVRTAQGWVSTVEGSMQKDKEQGRLRTVAGKASDDEALMEFLQMGR